MRHILCVLLLLLAIPASAAVRVNLPETGQPGQGFYIHVRADQPVQNVTIEWQKKSIAMDMQSEGKGYSGVALLAIPLKTDAKNFPLRVVVKTSKGQNQYTRNVKVVPKKYPEQHLKVAKKFVQLSEKSLTRHKKEKAKVKKALAAPVAERMWSAPFLRPVPGGISSEFGMTRFFNGEPRNPHRGLDLRGKTGTPIKATAGGVVKLVGNHFFSGKIAYIDHGQGVVSIYCHMSKIAVTNGERVKRGQVIGYVGKTGRVTGPHLHFGFMTHGTLIDPLPLLSKE